MGDVWLGMVSDPEKPSRGLQKGGAARTVEQGLELLLLSGGRGPADVELARQTELVCRAEGVRAEARVVLAALKKQAKVNMEVNILQIKATSRINSILPNKADIRHSKAIRPVKVRKAIAG